MSVKYSTLAKLTQQRYRELITEVPEFTKDLKEGIFKIKDRNKTFLMMNLDKIPYFQGLTEDILHDIMFSLETGKHEKGEIL